MKLLSPQVDSEEKSLILCDLFSTYMIQTLGRLDIA